MSWTKKYVGLLIPTFLLLSALLGVVGAATTHVNVDFLRPVMYLAGAVGVTLSFLSFFRANAGREGYPTLLSMSMFYLFGSLVLILVVISVSAVSDIIASMPDVPDWVLFGSLFGSCAAFLMSGIALYVGSRLGALSMQVDPWILRPFFRRRSFKEPGDG